MNLKGKLGNKKYSSHFLNYFKFRRNRLHDVKYLYFILKLLFFLIILDFSISPPVLLKPNYQAEIFPDKNHGGRVFYNEALMGSMGIP